MLSPETMSTRADFERAWAVTAHVVIWTAILVAFIMVLVVALMH
jgi:hypothetical protein